MVAISFVHPAILGGLALGALPIIIHLLNRRRFKSMDWAAMDFLLKAAVRNRRRVRLENLLLLLLRVAVVCLLIFAVARPFSKSGSALAGLFGSEGATQRIILLDNSHSMRAGTGNRSAFETAKARVKAMIDQLHEERSSDTVTVVLGSDPRGGDAGLVRVPIASKHADRMLDRLKSMRASDGTLDISTTIDALLDSVEEGSRMVLHVVSDFRRKDWTGPDGSMRPEVIEAFGRFSKRGEIRFIDVGSNPVSNVGVVELKPRGRAVIAGVPATFVATIRNHGPDPVSGVQVTFRFGDQALLPIRIEGTLHAGQQEDVTKDFTFRSDGPITVSAEVPADILPGDNIRRRVVDVRKTMRFLLVDGEPEHEDYRGETDFLAAALMPPGKVSSGIEVDPISEQAFSGRELETYDGLFLCNVYRLPDDRIKRIEDFVRAGGGLVFFLGDQVDASLYNTLFFGTGDEVGKKLLPLRLVETEGGADTYVHFNAPAVDHPVVRFLRGMNRIVFRTAAIRRWMRCDAPVTGTDSRVIMTYTDDNAAPALAEKSFGEGRVLMYTTAADLEWSNFPQSILYLAMLQETARYVVRPDPTASTMIVGNPIRIPFSPKRMQRAAMLVRPEDLGDAPLRLTLVEEKQKGEKTGKLYFRYNRTTVAGTYTLRLRSPDGLEFVMPFVHNVDPTEGDLARADIANLAKAVPGARVESASEDGAFGTESSDRAEFWRTLVYVLIAAAALETLLAWRFGHHKTAPTLEGDKQVFVR